MYALVDCNSFYASCEQVFRPDLQDQPVIVLSNNDGCVVARNKAAKALSIPDLEPYFKIKSILQRHRVQVFSSNYELYADFSQRVMQTLEGFAPEAEVYSIDEIFLRLDTMPVDFLKHGYEIKQTVKQHIGIPVSVGIAHTKTLSKLANFIAKKSLKCDGVCVIENTASWLAVFRKLPVAAVWGVGAATGRRLNSEGIVSVYDLLNVNPEQIRRRYNVCLERTVRELKGQRCIDLAQEPDPRQQIIRSRMFGERIYDEALLQEAVCQHVARASEKLRQQKSLLKTLWVFVKTSRFDHKPYNQSSVAQLPYPTNDTRVIQKVAKQAVKNIYLPGCAYAKAGVGFIEMIPECPGQQDLFEPGQSAKDFKVMEVIDKIKQRDLPIGFASQGLGQCQWFLKRDLKSPAYTTRWEELPWVIT